MALDGMSKGIISAVLGQGSKAKPITGSATFQPTEQKRVYTGGWWGYVEVCTVV